MSLSNPKGWIKSPCRNNHEYIHGIKFFMDFAMKHSPPGFTCSCPYRKCENKKKRASFGIVESHLILFGMLSTYDEWFHHGEKPGMNMAEDLNANLYKKIKSKTNF